MPPLSIPLVKSAKINGLEPEAYLRDVLARIADHPIRSGFGRDGFEKRFARQGRA